MSDTASTRKGKLPLREEATVRQGMAQSEPPGRSLSVRPKEAAQHLDIGERFVDEGEIGRGGMARVHRVYDRTLGRTVALKALSADAASDDAARDRFLSEAQVTGQLQHPNIVPVYELGTDDDGTHFFTMRLIDGVTLTRHVERLKKAGDGWLDELLEIFLRVCDAMSFAHSRGVVHRDLKPSNIMVGEHGQVYVVDWGIALVGEHVGDERSSRWSMPAPGTEPSVRRYVPASEARRRLQRAAVEEEAGVVLGTFAYMSPEQARGAIDDTDERTDVFGLGAVLYRLLAGRPPYQARTTTDMLRQATEAEPPPVDGEQTDPLTGQLLQVALIAMHKARDERYPHVRAFREAIQTARTGRGRFRVWYVAAGTRILRQGEEGDDAFYIRTGSCRVFRDDGDQDVELKRLGAGEVFGETAVFTGQTRTAHVQAATDVELVVVPGRSLVGMLGLDSWLGAFVRSLGARFAEGNARVSELKLAIASEQMAARVLGWLARNRRQEASIRELAAALDARAGRVTACAMTSDELVYIDDADDALVRLRA